MTIGFILGKFAPLHRGHQLLIDTALAEVDHVIVLVYDAPSTTTVPLATRAGWIRTLYPEVEVLEGHGSPEATGDTPDIRALQERYIASVVGDREVTHFYSSEFYGAHVAGSLGAADRRVDPGREQFPISGTALRGDPWSHRAFIATEVYRDLITRIVFVGAPSTGKTTIARRLAQEFATVWMPEYGREYWDRHQVNRRLSPDQLVEVAEEHRVREDALVPQANRYLFVDTDATTTWMFSHDYHGHARPRLDELAAATRDRYHLRFVCQPDFQFDETWDRSGDVHQQDFHERIRSDLVRRALPFHELGGSITKRIERVRRRLEGFDRHARSAED